MSDKKFLLISGGKKELTTPPNNQIYYRTTTGEKQDPYSVLHADGTTPIFVGTDGSQANLVSNEYKNGYGVMTFDKELGNINPDVENYISWSVQVTGVNLPDDIESSFTEVNLPASITKYDYTFAYCKNLSKCKIPYGVTYLRGTFVDCLPLYEIEFPDSVTFFDFVISGSGVKSIVVPEKVTVIGDETFTACELLKNVTIKTTALNQIGWAAFSGCASLETVDIRNSITLPSIRESNGDLSIFESCPNLKEIIVNPALIDEYKAADGWKEHADKIVAATE